MKHTAAIVWALALLLAAFTAPAGEHAPTSRPFAPNPDTIDFQDPPGPATPDDVRSYFRHVTTLADPRVMQGRAPGTEGIERAARYIQGVFQDLGLTPAFDRIETAADGSEVVTTNASFRQTMDFGSEANLTHQSMTLLSDTGHAPLVPGEDFNLLGYGVGGQATLPVVFAGYAIAAGEDGYLGFPSGADLEGKAAIVLRFEPMNDEGASKWIDQGWSYNAALTAKFSAVTRRGAQAVLLVTPPNAQDDRAGVLEDLDSSPQFGEPFQAPIIHLAPDRADELIRQTDPQGLGLADYIAKANEQGVVIDLPGARVAFDAGVEQEPVNTDNIGAVLPGRGGLENQYVVIGAHYDHLGQGRFGSRAPEREGEVHPGADDNASGTAGVLAAAEILKRRYSKLPSDTPLRSVLFLAFTAEETGLNGSRHYADNPPLPIDDHVLMINMDMIGRLDGMDAHLTAGGAGTAQGLSEMIEPVFDRSLMEVLTTTSIGSGRSDHASFDGVGVPTLFFFTGIHEDYHTPDDTVDKLNIEGGARIARLVADIAEAAATRERRFVYDPDRASAEPPQLAVHGGGDQGQGMGMGMGRMRVRVGIAPGDYAGRVRGVLVARVFEGTSAEEGGMRAGDRIIEWNGKDLSDVESWMPMLLEHAPGDVVPVKVIRGDQEIDLELTLKARGSAG